MAAAYAARTAPQPGVRLDGPDRVAALGGFRTVGSEVRVGLGVGPHRWQAPVLFCEPWPLPFALLGRQTFLQHLDVRIRAAEVLEVEPASTP